MENTESKSKGRAFRVCITLRADQREAASELQKCRMLSGLLQKAVDEYEKESYKEKVLGMNRGR